MALRTPEPVQVVKQRRDDALAAIVAAIPYIQFLNVLFERRGDELTAVMAYRDTLIGNPALPALHGGAIAAFLEVAAVIELTWATAWAAIEDGTLTPEAITSGHQFALPKTIDFTVDYLRSGVADTLCVILDASKLSIELKLLQELAVFARPMVVGVTKLDVAAERGETVDLAGLAEALNVEVCAVDGRSGEGAESLARLAHDLDLGGRLDHPHRAKDGRDIGQGRVRPALVEPVAQRGGQRGFLDRHPTRIAQNTWQHMHPVIVAHVLPGHDLIDPGHRGHHLAFHERRDHDRVGIRAHDERRGSPEFNRQIAPEPREIGDRGLIGQNGGIDPGFGKEERIIGRW